MLNSADVACKTTINVPLSLHLDVNRNYNKSKFSWSSLHRTNDLKNLDLLHSVKIVLLWTKPYL